VRAALAASLPIGTAASVLEIGLLLLLAVGAGWLLRRAGLPAVVGYLAVGLLVSPFTPGYVADRHQLELLADVGVVLLLFEVGVEINPLRVARERGPLLWAGPAQVILTALATGAACLALGLAPAAAVLVGLAVAMSSSVVVVNITRSRRRSTNRPTEEAMLAWSVLQDLTGVAVILLVLAWVGLSARPPVEAAALILAFLILAVAFAWLLPWLLHALQREHDLFLLLSVGSGLVVAGAGARFFGVPLALAAFVAGLAVGESPVAAEARRRILPFRDLFAVLFFVLLGSLVDPAGLGRAAPWIGFLLASVAVTKMAPVFLVARFARLPDVRPWQLAVGLGQVGEFSFVLASILLAAGLIPGELYLALVASVVVSIVFSTIVVRLGGRTASPLAGAAGD